MTESARYGTFPTPYGVEVEVHRNPDVPEDHDTAFWFSANACCVMAGIHDPEQRRRAVAEIGDIARARGGFPFEVLTRFGGGPIPRKPIGPAEDPIYAALVARGGGPVNDHGLNPRECIDGIATDLLDRHRWCDRAEYLLAFLGGNLPVLHQLPRTLGGLSLAHILSGVLELLGEREIDCLEAAAFFAISTHQPWRDAARSWLLPHRKTWVADWIEKRPDYRRAARLVSHVHPDVPSWLGSVTR